MNRLLPRIAFVLFVCLLFLSHAAGVYRIEPSTASLPAFSAGWPALDSLIMTPEFLLLATIGLLLSFCLPQLEPLPASLLTLASTVPPIYLIYTAVLQPSVLPLEYYLLVILILFVTNVLISYYAYSHQRQQIIDTFSHYVPAEVVRQLCREPDSFSLEGESRELTVLFADLVNFTSVAEQLEPRELTRLLNRHFDVMSSVLLDHDATIDKYIGDSVMAFWGAPLVQDEQSNKALDAAFAMQDTVAKLSRDFSERDWPMLELCIGINRGSMNVGNIGSSKRANYTVIGDAVNVASRLERLTREYRVPIITSEFVMQATPDYTYRQLDCLVLRGKQKPANIYQPLFKGTSNANDDNAWLGKHDRAIELYLNGSYRQAYEHFSELLEARPDDAYYRSMLDRIDRLSA